MDLAGWVHFSNNSHEFFDENSLHRVPQSPYSSNSTHSYFWLFRHMKTAQQGRKFEEREKLLMGIHNYLKEMQLSELMFVFHFWIECACRVIEHDGEYNQESTM
jgi:hypothetical protein